MRTSRRELINPRTRVETVAVVAMMVVVAVYGRERRTVVTRYMAVAEATPQRAVFHWINVTGERRLRFNYRVNLRFDRANASRWRRRRPRRGGDRRGDARPDWERNGLEKWGG